MHLKLAPQHEPVSLLVELPVARIVALTNDVEDTVIYANGVRCWPVDTPRGPMEHYFAITRLYNLKVAPETTDLTLVVRKLYVPFGLGSYTRFFSTHTLRIGSDADLRQSLELWRHRTLFERILNISFSIEILALSLFLIALYFTQQGHREYLWLALYHLVLAPIVFFDLAARFARVENLVYEAVNVFLSVLAAYFYFEFLADILDLHRRWARKRKRWFIHFLRWMLIFPLAIGPIIYFAGNSGDNVFGVLLAIFFMLFVGLWFVVWFFFCFINLIAATIRRNFEAGMLLIPLILSIIGICEPVLAMSIASVTGQPYRSPLTIQAGPIPIYFSSVANYIGTMAIVLIIFVRFQRIYRDQERTSSELAAARSVQELMIPHEKVKTPGFEVDSVYSPAAEVGGDFFYVETTPDGGMLIAIGDVAGKGLKAAMNVSMLMGALRSADVRNPARILESLNKAMVGSESFTTCQVAWFGPNGELVIANAGHLPPYLNSQEVALPGGLPLGVVSGVTYDEVRLFLHPGDRVLFLSDGVVEARQASGELFGFDRVHNLSNQSAFYIADAAKEFGQEDDITVLTVRRVASVTAAA
jgi:hypothetical protein